MKKNKGTEYAELKYFMPEFYINPLQKAVWEIENIIIKSGLPHNIEYRPDDGYFQVELYKQKEN